MLGFILLLLHISKFRLPVYVLSLIAVAPFLYGTNVLLTPSTCPNCLGVDVCESIANGDIQLHWLSKFFVILHPRLTKSVFFGTISSSRAVVLKSMTRRGQYRVKNYKLREREVFDIILKENVFISDEVIRNVILCPNVRSLHLLFRNVDENITNLIFNQKLWLDLQISIEPLLLKFMSSVDGMPVPAYCGACGDIIMKEYKGKSLTSYYKYKWITRAFLSIQLLKMAETFTFRHEYLIFYFTDLSSDNIAVDESGIIYLTDLDHVIIAERQLNISDNSSEKHLIHVTPILDEVKLTVTPSEVCFNPISDHNYFAVCKNILIHSEEMKQGLLNDIPRNIKHHEDLLDLLEECRQPRKHINRIIAGNLLRRILEEIVSDFTWEESS